MVGQGGTYSSGNALGSVHPNALRVGPAGRSAATPAILSHIFLLAMVTMGVTVGWVAVPAEDVCAKRDTPFDYPAGWVAVPTEEVCAKRDPPYVEYVEWRATVNAPRPNIVERFSSGTP